MDKFERIIKIRRELFGLKKEGFPIPSPSSDDNENDFISRCVSSIIDEYEQSVALGICYSKWNEK